MAVRRNSLVEDDGRQVCQRCAEQGADSYIRSWDYKPSAKFFHSTAEPQDPNRVMHYGTEFEIINKTGELRNAVVAKAITKTFGDVVYCKHDGSLGEYHGGFEIVTHPLTYKWIKDNLSKFDCIWELADKGFSSHNTGCCGMHIHLSRNMFTDFHVVKFLKFIYHMDRDFIRLISQRTQGSLNQWGNLGNRENVIDWAKRKYNSHGDRYTAVNMENSGSYELRIFRGSLRKDRFLKNIEFCESTYNFTRTASDRNITKANYISYLKEHEKSYKNLVAFLKEKEVY